MIANGNLERFEDISTSIRTSGADGVMAAEGLLSNPMLFDPSSEIAPWTRPLDLALEYLDICDTIPHKPAVGTMRGHCIRILYRL